MFVFGQDADYADHFLDEIHAAKGGKLQCDLAAVRARDDQQAVDQMRETPDLLQHTGDDFAVCLTGVDVLQAHLADAAHRSQRRAQLMRGVGGEALEL